MTTLRDMIHAMKLARPWLSAAAIEERCQRAWERQGVAEAPSRVQSAAMLENGYIALSDRIDDEEKTP